MKPTKNQVVYGSLSSLWTRCSIKKFKCNVQTFALMWPHSPPPVWIRSHFDGLSSIHIIISLGKCFTYISSENIRKPPVFWCFQWAEKCTNGTLVESGLKCKIENSYILPFDISNHNMFIFGSAIQLFVTRYICICCYFSIIFI